MWLDFVRVNSVIWGLTWISVKCIACPWVQNMFISVCLLLFMETSSKPQIQNTRKKRIDWTKGLLGLVTTSSLKTWAHLYIQSQLWSHGESLILPLDYMVFVLWSGLVEIIFDGVHYWVHRAFHTRYLWWIHRIHHKFSWPTSLSTFYMHPLDVMLAYNLPLLVALKLCGGRFWHFQLLCTYLTYQEIGGHAGKKLFPTSSFAQCIWLPRFFGIQLHTEDHDLHHTEHKVNFSKRFSLYDRMFGTYKCGVILETQVSRPRNA
uniref:Fatty acid hydroxylase domain-containing protein n=1 Tax=viral metagenome TaxID=1070528 RepID=A0A6C0BPF2_9ZZZZ